MRWPKVQQLQRPLLVDTILQMLAKDVIPQVPQQEVVGHQVIWRPLAHLGLVLADGDHGRVFYQGAGMSAAEGMQRAEIPRLQMEAKDGLAITNGAQLTTAIGTLALHDAVSLVEAAELAAAMSIEALRGASRAFVAGVRVATIEGAIATAGNLRALMAGSTLIDSMPEEASRCIFAPLHAAGAGRLSRCHWLCHFPGVH